jgi:hypothetical protein
MTRIFRASEAPVIQSRVDGEGSQNARRETFAMVSEQNAMPRILRSFAVYAALDDGETS